jgi:outer membrane protein assembly factor BamB
MRLRTPLRAILVSNLLLFLSPVALLSPPPRHPAPKQPPPAPLHLHWVRELPRLEPTWPDQPRFTGDAAYRPVVAGPLVLVASSRTDDVTAFDSSTGNERWRFAANGPVRFAPAVWRDLVYLASDDGFLYCLGLDGGLRWKFRGGPASRRILGNERLISTWPARGAPVVAGEPGEQATVYFAAGIWPFMGIFLHALDAKTGAVRWSNSGDGSTFIKQPHRADAFAGVAPQGPLVVAGDRLLVPGGRSIPACYDRRTGKRLHYRLSESSKLGGGPDVVAGADLYVNGTGAFDLLTGRYLGSVREPVAIHEHYLYSASLTACRAFDLKARPLPEPPPAKGKARPKKAKRPAFAEAWLGAPLASAAVPRTTALLCAGNRLYGGGDGVVFALDLPLVKGRTALAWRADVGGTAMHLAASEGQLFVGTREGRLYAFGARPAVSRRYPLQKNPLPAPPPDRMSLARKMLHAAGVRDGYCVVWGVGTGSLIRELLASTDLRIIVVEPDQIRASAFRAALRAAALGGSRVSVLHSAPDRAELPPYLCSLIASEDLGGAGVEVTGVFFDQVFRSLRPHGGVACFPLPTSGRRILKRWLERNPADGQVKPAEKDGLILLSRPGAPPGSAPWTHQHADAANTRVSRDKLVKAPLGILWFGGPGNQAILPRHGHGPVPQVIDGRLFIEGIDHLRAIDVYTGRLLWEARLPGVGKLYDNTSHQPGANGAGGNYVSTPAGVYVAYRKECLLLDPATGKPLRRFSLPPLPGERAPPDWTYLNVSDGYLVGGANPAKKPSGKKGRRATGGGESSRWLFVLDRLTGKVLWRTEAHKGFRHNAVCIGNARLYAIDRPPVLELVRKADRARLQTRLTAFDLRSGRVVWSSNREVFGTWLSYSAPHDVLVEAGLMTRDTFWDEAEGMRAYKGGNGAVLWRRKDYQGPALIHGERILKGGSRGGSGTACELLTGKPIHEPDPLTGRPMEWKWQRTYGCNTPAASEHLILFRSGAAGYFDLCRGGTGNLGGFRSSCTLNLIAAGGVLTVPDYTRTCTCSYQNQTSVGLIHTPEAELWTFTTARKVDGPIRRLGLLLNAPGSRRGEDGTLWLEHPPAGGPSPRLTVTTAPARLEPFRMHASQVRGDGLTWVAASGVRGLRKLTVTLSPTALAERVYTIRMHFLEPDRLPAGRRRFDVSLQGRVALRDFDVSREAGGPGTALVREVKGVRVRRDLTVTLTPAADAPVQQSVLCGLEVLAEGW